MNDSDFTEPDHEGSFMKDHFRELLTLAQEPK